MIRVCVNGAQGKMGQEAVKAIGNSSSLTLVSTLSRQDNLAAALCAQKPQVVVDLTSPEAVYENSLTIIQAGCHPVIGTTGLTSEETAHLQVLSAEKKVGGLIAPNFSIGALLLMQASVRLSRYFPEMEIIEAHHPQKKDAPSGTALRTANLLAQTVDKPIDSIPIHSIRLPGHVAQQTVIFGGNSERVTLCHDTLDRSCFMPGLLLACERVMSLNELVIGLENLLEDNGC